MTVIEADFEQSLIEAISQGLPLVKKPYEEIARQIGCSESLVLKAFNDYVIAAISKDSALSYAIATSVTKPTVWWSGIFQTIA